jgi:hypothetical protein
MEELKGLICSLMRFSSFEFLTLRFMLMLLRLSFAFKLRLIVITIEWHKPIMAYN